MQQVLSKHEEVFKEELGTLEGTINVKDNPVPHFFGPRSILYTLWAKVDGEIDRLLK